ncbi:14511_t:CDS:2, partial [Gigaspora margarita]
MNFETSKEKKIPSIANEELTPITKKEFIGWYILCAANGIYGGAPIGVLIPLFLETIAGQAGYELDLITPCNTASFSYYTLFTESYSLYIISISIIVQTALFISCGSLADHGKLQKLFALLYAFIGAITTILFAAVTSPQARDSNFPIAEIKQLEDRMNINLSANSLVASIFAAMLVIFSAGAILLLTDGSSYDIQMALAFSGSCWLTIVIITSVFSSMLPLYVILGYWLPFGGNNKWEVWLYLVWFGISIGTIFNYCRALFSIMLPIGHENEFFSLFQITSKGSSWIGTIASGIIINYTHDIRSPFWFLFLVTALPALIFCTVNVEKGSEDAEMYSNRERK